MHAAVHEMRAAGAVICHLWPFSFRYYRKLGWELPAPDLRVFLRPHELDQTLLRVPGELRIAPVRHEDAAALKAAHDRCASRYNGLTVRSAEWFAERLKDFDALLALDAEDQPAGYTLYRSEPHPAAGGQRRQCRETLASTPAVLVALLRGVVRLPETAQIVAELPGDSPLPHLLAERPTMSLHQCLQARVLDPARALGVLQPPADLTGRVAYAVDDPVLASDGPIVVEATIGNDKVDVRPATAQEALHCSIQTFTRLFCGGMRAGEARALGWLEGGSPEMEAVSDALLFRRRPYRSGLERG
jgi:predicted acetyltransferase